MIGRSLRRQRGFLYLTTGANGSGKTLFTLRDVRNLQVETSRPVFYAGFTPKQPLLDFGWQEFDPEKWQDLPDGSICLVDECQKWMPPRATGKPPSWIADILEVHRKRGFDFFFLTQHPLNMDAFIRRAIAAPGWHRHMKASFMGDTTNELKWTSVMSQPERPGSGASGFVTKRPFDKEVFTWYESASLHTAKKKVPLRLIAAIAGMFAAVAMAGYVAWGFYQQASGVGAPKPEQPAPAPTSYVSAPSAPSASSGGSERRPMTPAEYSASYTPRIQGLEHTAPVYDAMTTPKVVPLPAACVQWTGKGCKCFTQTGTPYRTTDEICVQIVRHGIFLPFEAPPALAQAVSISGDTTGTRSSPPVGRP